LSAARGQQRLNRIGSTSYPSERGNDVEPNQKQLSEASVTNSDDIQIQHTEEYNCDTSTDETLLLYQNNIEDLYDTGLDLIQDPYFYAKVKTVTGKYITGDRKIFLALVMFCGKRRNRFSTRDCDDLMQLVKWISRETRGEDIPLPSRYI